MNRIALFAHYDRDGVIDDYVIYYLRGLQRIARRILFVSDCELRPGEAGKLDGLAELVFAGRHGEYDFGSWKRAFAFLGDNLQAWDEVILANDSCYAPIFPFEDVFAKMDAEDCDFWGPTATEMNGKFDHLCSYFLVIRRTILHDQAFLQFWTKIAPQRDVDAVIEKYERGLSALLVNRGFTWGSYLPVAAVGSFATSEHIHKTIFERNLPLVKTKVFKQNPFDVPRLANSLDRIGRSYPIKLIDAHIDRMLGTADPVHYHYSLSSRREFTFFKHFSIKAKVKRDTLNPKHKSLLKVYVRFFRLQIRVLALPLPKQFR